MKLYFYQTKNRCFCKKNGFKQHCFKQPCLICFFFAIFAEDLLHSAILKPAFIALFCNFFAEEKLYSIK